LHVCNRELSHRLPWERAKTRFRPFLLGNWAEDRGGTTVFGGRDVGHAQLGSGGSCEVVLRRTHAPRRKTDSGIRYNGPVRENSPGREGKCLLPLRFAPNMRP